MTDMPANRREFLQAGASGIAALGLAADVLANEQRGGNGVPMRPFGRTGKMVSAMALGGHASTNPKKLSEAESLRLIQRAVDEGITFLDNAWDYHDGLAEERMGKALAAGATKSS